MINHLNSILRDLQECSSNKNEVMQQCINQRLNDSVRVYYDELTKSCEYLQKKNELKVMKKMVKG